MNTIFMITNYVYLYV